MRLSGLLNNVNRRHASAARSRARVLRAFSKKLGLVYFGLVDQHKDEHDIIRGLTVSTTHRDDHYAVGNYDGTDISVVDRFDVIVNPDGTVSEHFWVIFRLKLDKSIPHLFLKPLNHTPDSYTKLYNASHQLQPVNSVFLGAHSQEFNTRYEVFASVDQALEIEKLLTTDITQTIAARLWPHAVELVDGYLYFYTTDSTLTETLLESGLSSALWLVEVINQPDSED